LLSDVRLEAAGKQVPYILERPQLTRAIDLPFKSDSDSKRPSVSRWEIKLPHERTPLTSLVLQTKAPLFERRIRVVEKRLRPNGETSFTTIEYADWRRAPGEPQSSLRIPVQAIRGDTLWIETDNGDNAAIDLQRVQGTYPVVRLLFRTAEPSPLRLLTGNAQASAPRYDLNLVAPKLLASEKDVVTLSAAGDSGTAARKPLQIKSWIFWAALGAVVVVLLTVVAKLLPKGPGEKSK
jgi:hypothetical protein